MRELELVMVSCLECSRMVGGVGFIKTDTHDEDDGTVEEYVR